MTKFTWQYCKGMNSLCDIHILKSFKRLRVERPNHKYIRRWLENGKWQYEYPKKNVGVSAKYEDVEEGRKERGGFGTIWGDYSGRPIEAFNKLFKERSGQCSNVFTVKLPVLTYDSKRNRFIRVKQYGTDDYLYADTSIDLVWGSKDRNIGVEHIVDDHYVQHNDFNSIEELQERITHEMENFHFSKENLYFQFSGKFPGLSITTDNNSKFVFIAQFKRQKDGSVLFRHYILTSYDRSRGEADKKNPPDEVQNRQAIFDRYGKKKPKQ